ncbi:AaceriAAR053Wp [[Ashbya] aceris (nom. inval.)]|nr:AaceriAAR053Wp [[Ashbya] aceris (nom. inval.)]
MEENAYLDGAGDRATGDQAYDTGGYTSTSDGGSERGHYGEVEDRWGPPRDKDSHWEQDSSDQKLMGNKMLSEYSEETQRLFTHLQEVFQFQKDNCKNIYDYFVALVQSRRRGKRNNFERAVDTLYADYVFGPNSNFHKWYQFVYGEDEMPHWAYGTLDDRITQVALYLLIWGEANNVRFMPELLCYIFSIMCNHYYGNMLHDANTVGPFLDHAITPIYEYYYSQLTSGKDHSSVVGYDDINQCFWNRTFIYTLPVKGVGPLKMIPTDEHYVFFNRIAWNQCLVKTYYERRTWFHVVTNFHRVLVLHLSVYWYYLAFNAQPLYTKDYSIVEDNTPPTYVVLLVMSFAGALASSITLGALVGEAIFVPRRSPVATPMVTRFIVTTMSVIGNTVPAGVLLYLDLEFMGTPMGLLVATAILGFSLLTVVYYTLQPLKHLYTRAASDPFTSNIHNLSRHSQTASVGLWSLIFISKFVESYFFLTLSVKDPIRELFMLRIDNCNEDAWLGKWFCENHGKILTCLLIITHCVLFFLDTYLWYVLYTTVFSMCRSLHLGVSACVPWKNVFFNLPLRFCEKLLLKKGEEYDGLSFATIWNEIIFSMYREHILSFEHIKKLRCELDDDGELRGPPIFMKRKSKAIKATVFKKSAEARRRLGFFSKSLSCPMPEPYPTSEMPMFSVLIPHFKEKIILSIKDIVKGENDSTHVILLEYLKLLYADDWKTFIQETGSLYNDDDEKASNRANALSDHESCATRALFSLPYSFAGFKTDTPEYTLRTRIWASLRTQTLYRTISGFMKYKGAISLLHRYETDCTTEEATEMALSKFRIVCSMQRMSKFTEEELEDRDYLMSVFPNLQIAYVDEEYDPATGKKVYYSSLIDGYCDTTEDGTWKPRYKIRLSGNPVVGDGKSDNQNHAIIFTRGEYIQLIDANQDNYLEECLKIKSVLSEFENDVPDKTDITGVLNPVAIVGSREHVFSEKTGVLGDLAAGKEQVFGTFFARTLAYVGAKLHYGHPDFVNAIFVTTRGGVSKAQKGLHLSEDLFVGMSSILRGGRIKHCEYTQCGKGRDLGFGSILNFATKISAGMGEQILSREYFYLCSNLPLDRFLSFYYAHPGYYLNNVSIILSITLFMILILSIAVLVDTSEICDDRMTHQELQDLNCANIKPVIRWLRRSVLSIFIVSTASSFPMFAEDISEKSISTGVRRILKHLITGAPMFEIFVCKVYSGSLINDLYAGGARYIATGRGLAVIRVPFANLYSKFAPESFYFSFCCLLVLLFATTTMWDPVLIYFWFTISSLLLSPFIFNPNQFSWNDFIVDYKNYWKWLSSSRIGGNIDSWISYTRNSHLKSTSSQNAIMGTPKVKEVLSVCSRTLWTLLIFIPYIFINSRSTVPFSTNTIRYVVMRIVVLSAMPIVLNAIWLIILSMVSIICSLTLRKMAPGYPKVICSIAHGLGIFSHLASFGLLCILHRWDLRFIIMSLLVATLLESLFLRIIGLLDFTYNKYAEKSNFAWWSGLWLNEKFSWRYALEPLCEYVRKVMELSWFCSDFVLGHLLLFFQIPILLVPNINKIHSFMLFWKKAGFQIRPLLFSRKIKKKRQRITRLYSCIFIIMLFFFIALLLSPLLLDKVFHLRFDHTVPSRIRILFHSDTRTSNNNPP